MFPFSVSLELALMKKRFLVRGASHFPRVIMEGSVMHLVASTWEELGLTGKLIKSLVLGIPVYAIVWAGHWFSIRKDFTDLSKAFLFDAAAMTVISRSVQSPRPLKFALELT